MLLPDVNVLIYAHREDAPEHGRYAAWLTSLTEASEPFALSEIVLASYLRIVTNQDLRSTDAYLAALAIEHGCELVTTDSDFARFQGLRWRHPLAV